MSVCLSVCSLQYMCDTLWICPTHHQDRNVKMENMPLFISWLDGGKCPDTRLWLHYSTLYHSEEHVFSGVCFFVCLFVSPHDNFRTSRHRLMKLGGKCIVQKSRPSSNLGVIDPGCAPPKMWRWATTLGKSVQAV